MKFQRTGQTPLAGRYAMMTTGVTVGLVKGRKNHYPFLVRGFSDVLYLSSCESLGVLAVCDWYDEMALILY